GSSGEPRPPPTVGYLQAREQASTANPARPLVLDCAGHHLEGLGTSAVGRSLRHGCALAAPANPLWRAPRIHGGLLKLGTEFSERTVSRLLQTVERPPSQTWKTFLKTHV